MPAPGRPRGSPGVVKSASRMRTVTKMRADNASLRRSAAAASTPRAHLREERRRGSVSNVSSRLMLFATSRSATSASSTPRTRCDNHAASLSDESRGRRRIERARPRPFEAQRPRVLPSTWGRCRECRRASCRMNSSSGRAHDGHRSPRCRAWAWPAPRRAWRPASFRRRWKR